MVQKLDNVVSMLSEVSYGQVGGSFPPEAHVIALKSSTAKKSKLLTIRPNLWPKSQLGVVPQQNSVVKDLKHHIKWYTIPPPKRGGGTTQED